MRFPVVLPMVIPNGMILWFYYGIIPLFLKLMARPVVVRLVFRMVVLWSFLWFSLWFSYGFPMAVLWCSSGFPMVFFLIRSFMVVPMVFLSVRLTEFSCIVGEWWKKLTITPFTMVVPYPGFPMVKNLAGMVFTMVFNYGCPLVVLMVVLCRFPSWSQPMVDPEGMFTMVCPMVILWPQPMVLTMVVLMVFLWFSYRHGPNLWFPYGFPIIFAMVFLWLSYGCPMPCPMVKAMVLAMVPFYQVFNLWWVRWKSSLLRHVTMAPTYGFPMVKNLAGMVFTMVPTYGGSWLFAHYGMPFTMVATYGESWMIFTIPWFSYSFPMVPTLSVFLIVFLWNAIHYGPNLWLSYGWKLWFSLSCHSPGPQPWWVVPKGFHYYAIHLWFSNGFPMVKNLAMECLMVFMVFNFVEWPTGFPSGCHMGTPMV